MSERVASYPEGSALDEASAVRLFLLNAPHLLRQARTARGTKATSYRGLHVGAAGMGVNPYTGEVYMTSGTGNIKPSQHVETVCAEPPTIEALKKAGTILTVGITAVATNSKKLIQGITGHATETLHPCWRCMAFMTDDETILDSTLILTGGGGDPSDKSSKSNVYQLHTFSDLKFIYGEPSNPERDQGRPFQNLRLSEVPEEYDRLVVKYAAQGIDFEPARLAIQAFSHCSD